MARPSRWTPRVRTRRSLYLSTDALRAETPWLAIKKIRDGSSFRPSSRNVPTSFTTPFVFLRKYCPGTGRPAAADRTNPLDTRRMYIIPFRTAGREIRPSIGSSSFSARQRRVRGITRSGDGFWSFTSGSDPFRRRRSPRNERHGKFLLSAALYLGRYSETESYSTFLRVLIHAVLLVGPKITGDFCISRAPRIIFSRIPSYNWTPARGSLRWRRVASRDQGYIRARSKARVVSRVITADGIVRLS